MTAGPTPSRCGVKTCAGQPPSGVEIVICSCGIATILRQKGGRMADDRFEAGRRCGQATDDGSIHSVPRGQLCPEPAGSGLGPPHSAEESPPLTAEGHTSEVSRKASTCHPSKRILP